VNLLGPSLLGFRCRDDVREITQLLASYGIDVAVVAPMGARPADLQRIPAADANVCLYPEVAGTLCSWLERQFGMVCARTVPIGIGATVAFLREVHGLLDLELPVELKPGADGVCEAERRSRLPWYSRSVDSTYLTGKRVFVFGDATHAIAAARVAAEDLGFQVVGLGTYSREFARDVREAAATYGVEPLISDDYLEVEQKIAEAQPELVLGTQMERHIAKRLKLPCAVISAPVHVQDFPARYSPQMGFEGAAVLFDTWVHPLMMGLEEHLLTMFREDFEFHEGAAASHLSHAGAPSEGVPVASQAPVVEPAPAPAANEPAPVEAAVAVAAQAGATWAPDAQKELQKVPFFVRGKARRNTERFAVERGLALITVETLYDAKAHFGR
jgi:light-independent protochlorophyllide reductase subunit B